MRVHLVDGTYELFRAFFGAPQVRHDGREVGATRGILKSLFALLREPDVTHVGIAFDTVIESFRNELFEDYKTGEGVPETLMSQFPLAERAAEALGIATWRMVEFECDDALATFAARAEADRAVEQVVICSPDKDLAQCIRGSRVVCYDRMRRRVLDEAGVVEKFGIGPASIPDWLALVGDDADGIPGVPRWGAKSASAVLAHYGHLEAIPDEASQWQVKVRGAEALAESLRHHRIEVALYRRLATLRTDVPLAEQVADLEWRGARREALAQLSIEIGEDDVFARMERWR
ncbi:MAG: flap endonuclease [Gemmatimonadaceae bacterium]|nr:flap endonuclease [Gemmatimonadaceae bacterium]